MSDAVDLVLHGRRRRDDGAGPRPWPVLVVDDDPQVHQATRDNLRELSFEGRPFQCLSAHSAAEGAAMLAADPDIPVMLLDVVMETPDAGLRLVQQVRDHLGNRRVRIILCTGAPGEAPEHDVVLGYDVNDYKSKPELAGPRLFTTLATAIRAWSDLVTIDRLNADLSRLNDSLERRVADRTRELEDSHLALERAKHRAEQALGRETDAKRQLRQFLSMVSHEFRTPLAIIDSAAQMLQLRCDGSDAAVSRRLDTIRGAVQRLIGLIETCLADEQLDSGRIVLHERAIDLVAVLAAAQAHQQATVPARAISFDTDALPPVWGDPAMLALVFNNLIGNALKYGADGPVEIRAWTDGADVAVTVRDYGIGVPEGEREAIFERFHRAANVHGIAGSGIFERFHRAANVHGIAGSGIGLHMARQIVEMHGGTIALDSAPGGRGSCVTVRLRPAPPERS